MADATADFLKWHQALSPADKQKFATTVAAKQNAPAPVPLNSAPTIPAATPAQSPYGKPLTGAYTPQQTEVFRNDPNNQDIIRKLTDAATQRYGQAPDSTVLGLANKVQNEGYPMEKVLQLLQGGYGINNPDLQKAADQVGAQYDPQQSAIQRALDQAQRDQQLRNNQANAFGSRADQSLQGIYDSLQKELEANQGALKGIYDTGQQQVGQAYAGAQQAVQGGATGAQEALAAMAAKLGIGDALPAASAGTSAALEQFLTSNGAAQAGSLSNLATLGAGEQGIAQRGIGDSRKELAQNRSNILEQVGQMIAQSNTDYNTEATDLRGQLGDIAGARGQALRTALDDVSNARTEQERQAKLDALAEEIQRGTLDIQKGQLALSGRELDMTAGQNSFNNSLALQQLNMDKQKLEASISSASDPMQALQDQAKLQLTLAQIDKLQNPANAKLQGGQVGLNDFMNSIQAGPKFSAAVNQILDAAITKYQDPGALSSKQQDPYLNALSLSAQYPGLDQNKLRQAITIFFKKY